MRIARNTKRYVVVFELALVTGLYSLGLARRAGFRSLFRRKPLFSSVPNGNASPSG